MIKEYGIHSRYYLERARKRLNEGSLESLLYAAFELRCGIEARLHQYLEAQERISNKKKHGWKIPKLAEELERIFRTGDKVVRIDILDENTREKRKSFYYTPVNAELREKAQKLGSLMHHPKIYRASCDVWWNETKTFLETIYTELADANKGTLLGVPLINRDTRKMQLEVEVADDKIVEELIGSVGIIGETLIFTVTYLDELPNDL